MPEWLDIEEAAQPEFGTPDPPPDLPVGAGEILRAPAEPHFHHADAVTLLRQAMRRHAAAEAGADDDVVVIVSPGHCFFPPVTLLNSFRSQLQGKSYA